jgi:hypothetical protein
LIECTYTNLRIPSLKLFIKKNQTLFRLWIEETYRRKKILSKESRQAKMAKQAHPLLHTMRGKAEYPSPKWPSTHIRFYTRCEARQNIHLQKHQARTSAFTHDARQGRISVSKSTKHAHLLLHTMRGKAEYPSPKWPSKHIRFYTRCEARQNIHLQKHQAHTSTFTHDAGQKRRRRKLPMQQICIWAECGRRLKRPIRIINLYTVMKNARPHLPMYSGWGMANGRCLWLIIFGTCELETFLVRTWHRRRRVLTKITENKKQTNCPGHVKRRVLGHTAGPASSFTTTSIVITSRHRHSRVVAN